MQAVIVELETITRSFHGDSYEENDDGDGNDAEDADVDDGYEDHVDGNGDVDGESQALETYKAVHRRFPDNVECLKFLVKL